MPQKCPHCASSMRLELNQTVVAHPSEVTCHLAGRTFMVEPQKPGAIRTSWVQYCAKHVQSPVADVPRDIVSPAGEQPVPEPAVTTAPVATPEPLPIPGIQAAPVMPPAAPVPAAPTPPMAPAAPPVMPGVPGTQV